MTTTPILSVEREYVRTFAYVAVVVFVLRYILHKILKLNQPAMPCELYFKKKSLTVQSIVNGCPELSKTYTPTWLWGKSGHIQTIVFGIMRKKNSDDLDSSRIVDVLSDGNTITFQVFNSIVPHPSGTEYTILICPGIFGDYKKNYVQAIVHAAVRVGFRCCVLNHLGMPTDITLATPRLFTYGDTEPFALMCQNIMTRYPDSKFIALGFSMGANVVCKYIGEEPTRQSKFLCAISICQGYDIQKVQQTLLQPPPMLRFYTFVLTQRFLALIKKHSQTFYDRSFLTEHSIDLCKVKAARSLYEFDKEFTVKWTKSNSMDEFAFQNSCSRNILNINRVPLLLVNSLDDPLIGEAYHDIPKKAAECNDNVIFCETLHGGHLGFFENGWLMPHDNFLEKLILSYMSTVIELEEIQ